MKTEYPTLLNTKMDTGRTINPGESFTCAICGRSNIFPGTPEIREAAGILKGIGRDPARHFGCVNVCNKCSVELSTPRFITDSDGKERILDPIDPVSLRNKKQKSNRIKYRRPLRIPDAYINTTPEGAIYPEVFKSMMRYKYTRKGIIAVGDTGAGKSCAVWYLISKLHVRGFTIMDIDATKLVNMANSKFQDGTGPQWIEQMAMADILFIDDFGNEPVTNRGESTIFTIFKRRDDAGRPIFLTTQKTNEQIWKQSRDKDRTLALIRRIEKNCQRIIFADSGSKWGQLK